MKCVMKMKERNKRTGKSDPHVKVLLIKGGAKNLRSMVVDTMKVLFI